MVVAPGELLLISVKVTVALGVAVPVKCTVLKLVIRLFRGPSVAGSRLTVTIGLTVVFAPRFADAIWASTREILPSRFASASNAYFDEVDVAPSFEMIVWMSVVAHRAGAGGVAGQVETEQEVAGGLRGPLDLHGVDHRRLAGLGNRNRRRTAELIGLPSLLALTSA